METVPPPLRPVAARPLPAAPAAPAAARSPAAKRSAPKPPPPAQHGARAVHREMTDPSHPMARLLASAGDRALRPDRPAPAAERAAPPGAATRPGAAPVWPADAALSPPAGEDELRPVHVAEPEPEPEASEPATLESLAARFGAAGAAGAAGAPGAAGDGEKRQARGTRDRSREARERQAAILARLRQGDG